MTTETMLIKMAMTITMTNITIDYNAVVFGWTWGGKFILIVKEKGNWFLCKP